METRSHPRGDNRPAGGAAENAFRCGCGNLLARIVAEGVEIKCRRCKRRVIVPLHAKGTVRIDL